MPTTYASPQDPTVQLQPVSGPLIMWGCPKTQGLFFLPHSVYHLATAYLSVSFDALKALPTVSENRKTLSCANCLDLMSPVILRDVPLDFCRSCGALWFDAGELHTLTEGQLGVPKGETVPLKTAKPPASTAPEARPLAHERARPVPGWASRESEAMLDGLEQLFAEEIIQIEQAYTQAELLTGWESSNRYHACTPYGEPLAHMLERSDGWGGIAKRLFMGSRRALEIEVLNRSYKQVLLDIKRPFSWFWSEMEVKTPTGVKLGTVKRRFSMLSRRFELLDQSDRHFATIDSPFWRFWTFPVCDLQGSQRSTISKKWSGFVKEMYTTADLFKLDFKGADWTLAQRCVIFAAALSIDMDFFEHNNKGLLTG